MIKLSEFGPMEVFGVIFLFLIILISFIFAETVRSWIRISHRTTNNREREEVLFKLERVCKHFKLRSLSSLTNLCDWFDGLGLTFLALIAIWIFIRCFILKV